MQRREGVIESGPPDLTDNYPERADFVRRGAALGVHMGAVLCSAPTTERERLVALASGRDSYQFLSAALAWLREPSADAELGLHVLRHYAMLGLIGPALEIAAALPEAIRAMPEIDSAVRTLAEAPSGRVPWEQLDGRFRANLAALTARFPEMVRMIEGSWPAAARRLELYRCTDGNYQLSTIGPDGRRIWLPGLVDWAVQTRRFEIPRDPNALLPAPYLVEGVNFSGIIGRVVAETRKTFLNYRPAIYIVEPNIEALAAALHVQDWREILSEPRVLVFAGPEASRRFVAALLEDDELSLPQYRIRARTWGAGRDTSVAAAIQEVHRARLEMCKSLLEEVGAIYGPRDVAYWAERYRTADGKQPLRIVLAVSRHTTYLKYCMRDLAAAFERRGMPTRTIIERTDHGRLSVMSHLRLIRDFQPDLVFMIDHFRREYPWAIPENLPFVGWIQDLLPNIYCTEAGRSLGPLDFYVAPELLDLQRKYDYPKSQGMAWTMATDIRTFSPEPLPEDDLAPHRCDFSYVSSHSKPPERFHEEKRRELEGSASGQALLDCLFEKLRRAVREEPLNACASLGKYFRRAQDEGFALPEPEVRERILHYYLFPLAELLIRQTTLEWVADYCDRTGRTLHLYGNGWQEHPRFARYARGFAENGRCLRAIYQASTINLQIIATGAVHQRLLDGLAAGGFFLIRYTPADMLHEPAARLLEAVRRFGPREGVRYTRAQCPALADALEGWWAHQGLPDRADEFVWHDKFAAPLAAAEAGGFIRQAGAVFDEYRQISFGTRDEFERRAEAFLADGDSRRAVSESMRRVVIERFGYDRFVEALLAFVRERLEAAASARSEGGRAPAPDGRAQA